MSGVHYNDPFNFRKVEVNGSNNLVVARGVVDVLDNYNSVTASPDGGNEFYTSPGVNLFIGGQKYDQDTIAFKGPVNAPDLNGSYELSNFPDFDLALSGPNDVFGSVFDLESAKYGEVPRF